MAGLVHGCLSSSFSCLNSLVLFAGVGLNVYLVVKVAVVVAVVARDEQ